MSLLKLCSSIFCPFLLIFMSLNFTLLSAVSNKNSHRDLKLALSLENEFWMNIQEKKINKVARMLASNYQERVPGFIQNKQEQIQQLKQANLLGFGFNRPQVVRKGRFLTVSYDLLAIGNGVMSGSQVAVWKKINSISKKPTWKIVERSSVPFSPVILVN